MNGPTPTPVSLPAATATPTAWLRPATATPLPAAAPVARHTGLTGHAPPWAKTVAVGVLFAGIVAALAAAYYRRKLAAWRARLMAYLTAKKQAEARAQAEAEAAAPPPEPYQPPPGSPEAALLEGDLLTPGKTPQVVHKPPPASSQPVDVAKWKQVDYQGVAAYQTAMRADEAFDAEVGMEEHPSLSRRPSVKWGKLFTGLSMQIAGLLTLDLGLLMWGVVVPEHVAGILSTPFTGGSLELLIALDTPAQLAIGGYLVGMGIGLMGAGTVMIIQSLHLPSLWHSRRTQP